MRKTIVVVLALLLAAVMLPVTAMAADAKYDITDEAGLRAAVEAMAEGDKVTVRLQNDVTVVGSLEVKAGTLTILGQGHTITFGKPNSTMWITGNGIVNLGTKEGEGNDLLTLTSDNITHCVVNMSGSAVLNMYHGVTIKDSATGTQAGGVQLLGENTVFNMYGGVIDNCKSLSAVAGGVCIDGGALFNMYDGVIQNCSGWQGGAVSVSAAPVIGEYISGSSGFHMYGGTIKDCHDSWYGGGAVCAYTAEPVSFIMDGGTITGCSADGEGYGGAVFICTTNKDAVIEINKGEITGNSGAYGGGVFVYEGAVKIADGVALHSNTATKEGDDLYNEKGSITLGEMPKKLKLSPCMDTIDGWYHDEDGARWSSKKCGGEEDQMEKYTETTITGSCALKAAHGKKQVIIEPEEPEQEAPNPGTGANDFVGAAVAVAVISAMGAAAVVRKK